LKMESDPKWQFSTKRFGYCSAYGVIVPMREPICSVPPSRDDR
jgi:hypothetical protein